MDEKSFGLRLDILFSLPRNRPTIIASAGEYLGHVQGVFFSGSSLFENSARVWFPPRRVTWLNGHVNLDVDARVGPDILPGWPVSAVGAGVRGGGRIFFFFF